MHARTILVTKQFAPTLDRNRIFKFRRNARPLRSNHRRAGAGCAADVRDASDSERPPKNAGQPVRQSHADLVAAGARPSIEKMIRTTVGCR